MVDAHAGTLALAPLEDMDAYIKHITAVSNWIVGFYKLPNGGELGPRQQTGRTLRQGGYIGGGTIYMFQTKIDT